MNDKLGKPQKRVNQKQNEENLNVIGESEEGLNEDLNGYVEREKVFDNSFDETVVVFVFTSLSMNEL